MTGAEPSAPNSDRRPRRRPLLVIVGATVIVLAVFGLLRLRTPSRAGTEVHVTLQLGVLGPNTAWVDPSTGRVWCLVAGQDPPKATGRWSDGIEHGGPESSGTLRFEDDMHATFVPNTDGRNIALQQGGKFSC